MSIVSALGFVIFGMVAGALLTVRIWGQIWVKSMYEPGNLAKFIRGLAENLRNQKNSACDVHGCLFCGATKACPCCGTRVETKEERETLVLLTNFTGSLQASDVEGLRGVLTHAQLKMLERIAEMCVPRAASPEEARELEDLYGARPL
jgi:hypothetical protein